MTGGYQIPNAFDKLFCAVDSLAGHFGRDMRTRAGEVVGNAFEIVGAAEESADLIVDARVIPDQPAKFPLQTAMAFVGAPAAFEDQSLRRVKPGQIGNAPGLLIKMHTETRLGLVEQFACLVEISGGLLLHRSMPSIRIAYISGMRGSS